MNWRKILKSNKRNILITILFFIIFSSLSTDPVLACSVVGGSNFIIKAPSLKCKFALKRVYETIPSNASVIDFIKSRTPPYSPDTNCDNLVLTANEQEIFRNIINQFNGPHAFDFINIEKQSESEYLNLQKKVDKINADRCDCIRVDNVTQHGSWTVYEEIRDCPTAPDCQAIPPEGCFSRVVYDLLWGNPIVLLILFLAIPIGFIVGLTFLIRFALKKVKKK